jgi:AcrR family transcriptional regulator
MPPARDRRVRRSRAALVHAAIALVTEQGTADVPVSDIAEAADVSRRLVYQQFRDRDTLLLEAALDLARRELLPGVTAGPDPRAQTLALASHMAAYRPFYRAVLTSPCGFALSRALRGLFLPLNRQAVELMFGDRVDGRTSDDLATFLTGGWGAFVDTWVVDGPDPLDPEQFTDRLLAAASALVVPTTNPTPPPGRCCP